MRAAADLLLPDMFFLGIAAAAGAFALSTLLYNSGRPATVRVPATESELYRTSNQQTARLPGS